jgi:hypothetical protein
MALVFAALLVLAAVPAWAGAAAVHWGRAVRVEPSRNGGVDAVSCPTVRLCVAVDASGYVVTTGNPTGRSHVWSATARIDHTALTGVSCPTTRLCVATDDAGSVLTSTNPTGGARAWSRPTRVDTTAAAGGGYAGLAAISCPSTRLCVAVDAADSANVVTSTNPTGGAHAWRVSSLGGILTSVSCPRASLCVLAGTQHFDSTSPAGGAGAWHATGPQDGGGVMSALDCPSLTLCVATGYGDTSTGLITATDNPRGPASAWKTTSVQNSPPDPGEGALDAVGCARGLCVALDGFDNAYTSPAPVTGTWSGPAPIRPKSISQANAISCVDTLCVVVDSAGVSTAGIVRG